MTIKRRVATVTTDGSGDGTATLGLGAAFGRVFAVQWDSGADTSSDLTVSSSLPAVGATAAKTHAIYTRTSVDASAAGGIVNYVGPVETDIYDTGGDASANTEGQAIGVIAASPVSIVVANGGATETHKVILYVEV